MLDFAKDYVLENERVRLRPLQPTDLEHLKIYALEQPSLWQYSLQSAAGIDNMQKYIHTALQRRAASDSYPFLVYDKLTDSYAGSTRYYDYQPPHSTVQLGYTWYGQEYWGTGLNKNCKLLMLSFAFEQMKAERVEFRADANNARSIAAMKSLGCTVEGILRSNCQGVTGRRDSIILSILKAEWEGGLHERLAEKVNQASRG